MGTVPKLARFSIASDSIGKVIGPRGKGRREERAKYTGPEPVEGEVYRGKITGVHPFGVFLQFMPEAEDGSYPGLEGLCHVSELAVDRIRNREGFVKAMNAEEFDVVYMGFNKAGKRQLSRKAALGGKGGHKPTQAPSEPTQAPSEPMAAVSMSEQELDVITKAIEGV